MCALAALLAGCASTGEKTSAGSAGASSSQGAVKYKADDGRTIDIGKASASDGGRSFKNPHMEKCWIAEGFDFNGYDTLYIAETQSTAKFNKDEERPHQLAKEGLVSELARSLGAKGIFPSIVTREADIKPGAKTLKLENTIVEYAKGGGAARYFAGLYGAGQPKFRVQGKMSDGAKAVFTFDARRSGVSAGARMGGAFMKDEDIQLEDVRSLVLDLTDFVAAIAGKYQPKG
jgi:hypothetical protein